MAALLKVNTFQNASGGENTTYLSRPLANAQPAPTSSLSTGIWYTSSSDMMIVVNRNAETNNYCYYTVYIAAYPSATNYSKMQANSYTPYGSRSTNTVFLPKGMWFKVTNDSGNAPDIWMYKLGTESLTSL